MKTPPDPPRSSKRHSRKCVICTHPDREAIDEAFLHQPRNQNIVKDFNLPSLSSLYRHAHATGLGRASDSNRESKAAPQEANSNRESNRENEPRPPEQAQTRPQPNSNRESNQLQNSNRENDAGSGLMIQPGKVMSSGPARMVMTAEIQRMLIGK